MLESSRAGFSRETPALISTENTEGLKKAFNELMSRRYGREAASHLEAGGCATGGRAS